MIDVITPTLWRSDRLAVYAHNVHEATAAEHVVTFVAEADDQATLDVVGYLQSVDASIRLVVNDRAKSCLGAFNAGVAASTEPFWFASGDDVRFHAGWDALCLAKMNAETWVVGTNDLYNPNVTRGRAATHFLVDRRFSDSIGGTYDETPGVVAWEGYGHDYFDWELVEVAKAHGRWAPCLESVVEHRHWAFKQSRRDATYERNLSMCEGDRALHDRRRAEWEARRAAA